MMKRKEKKRDKMIILFYSNLSIYLSILTFPDLYVAELSSL